MSAELWAQYEYKLEATSKPKLITIIDAIQRAAESNIEYKKAQAEYTQRQSRMWLKTSKLLPDFSFTSNFNVRGEPSMNKTGFMLNMPLFDTKSLVGAKAGYEELKAARLNFDYAHERIIHNIASLYIEALKASLIKQVAKEEQEKFLKYVSIMQRMTKSGSARALDLTLAEYQSHKYASDYVLKEREYQTKLAALGLEINIKEDFEIQII